MKKYFWFFAIVLLACALVFQCRGAGSGTLSDDDDTEEPDINKPSAPSDGLGGVLLGGDTRRSIVPEGYFANWAPGIPDGIPKYTNINTTINASTYGNGVTNASPAIQAAIDAAGLVASAENPQVVFLPAGTYKADDPIVINKSYIVLRGEGTSTVIRGHSTGNQWGAITIGSMEPNFSQTKVVNLASSANVGDSSITVENVDTFKAGDLLVIDRLGDDGGDPFGTNALGSEWVGNNWYHLRGGNSGGQGWHHNMGPDSPEGRRPVRQYIEIKSISGNTLHLTNRINIAFPLTGAAGKSLAPQVWKTGDNVTHYSGIENLKMQTYCDTYNHTPSIVFHFDSAYSWVKNVESDGSWGNYEQFRGVHIRVRGLRNHVTGCYVHDSSNNWPGGTGYGIELHGTDCLIDNNIATMLCKPILGYVSGGGNVIAYNYIPNTAEYDPGHGWQETGIDTGHASYCHSDMYEGNYSVNLSTDSTSGNQGWMVFFRNYAWGKNLDKKTGGPLNAVGIHGWSNEHASIGNVYLDPKDVADGLVASRWNIPLNPNNGWVVYGIGVMARHSNGLGPGSNDVTNNVGAQSYNLDFYDENPSGWAFSKFHYHLDYNYFNDYIYDNPGNSVKDLPDSLFLAASPGYFSGYAWPPVNPKAETHEERVSGLPAEARYNSKTYMMP